jgi:tetratricopeptide (TPR) repeat protein
LFTAVYNYPMIAGLRPFFLFTLAAFACAQAQTTATPANAGAPAPAPASAPAAAPNSIETQEASVANIVNDPAVPMLKKAYAMITVPKPDYDGALPLVDEAIKNNPKSFAAYTLRGMIYSQKKQWTSAESDFNSALTYDPGNLVVRFNLAELKFMQKQYSEARTRFELLTKDKTMGEFARYKVYLCNLFGGNEIAAKQTLDSWDEETGPSFFWGTAAWDLAHKNPDDARSWIASAIRIFPPTQNNFYAQSLLDLGYLPLPPAPTPST